MYKDRLNQPRANHAEMTRRQVLHIPMGSIQASAATMRFDYTPTPDLNRDVVGGDQVLLVVQGMRSLTGIGRTNIGQPVRLDRDLSDEWSDALKKALHNGIDPQIRRGEEVANRVLQATWGKNSHCDRATKK